jgi:hypothetical protein
MAASKEIEQVRLLVLDLLTKDPKYRDSDKLLSAKVWTIQMGGYQALKTTTSYEFLVEYTKKKSKLFSQDSIGRARRKLQEEIPELQGLKYKKRQEHQADVVKALGYGKKDTN